MCMVSIIVICILNSPFRRVSCFDPSYFAIPPREDRFSSEDQSRSATALVPFCSAFLAKIGSDQKLK